MSDYIPKVIFLCNHNSARSQMAEAFLRHLSPREISVFSAGLGRKQIKPTVHNVMAEVGITLEGYYSKTVEDIEDLQPFDFAFIVCGGSECPGFANLANHMFHWEIKSPYHERRPAELTGPEKLVHYRSLRDQIHSHVYDWVNHYDSTAPRMVNQCPA